MRLDKRYLFGGISVLVLCLAVAGSLYVAFAGDTGTVAAKSSAVNRTVGGATGAPAAVNAAAIGAGTQLVSAAPAAASGSDPFVIQYSGEFLCGQIPSTVAGPLGPGIYNTDIAVHNPATDPVVYIQKKAVPLPPSAATGAPETLGSPTSRKYPSMGPDTAFELDCQDILTEFGPACVPTPGTNFCKGYLVVEAAKPAPTSAGNPPLIPTLLDVTVTTTVTNPSTGDTHMTVANPLPHLVAYPCWSNTAVPPCP